MNKSFFISGFAFEVLIRSQCDAPIYLPGEQKIETSSDNDIIYGIHSMVECGALEIADDEKGFNVTSDFEPVVKTVINAKAILRAMRADSEYPIYYYVSDGSVAFIETVINRNNTYRIGTVANGALAEIICESMNLPCDDSETNEKIEHFLDLSRENGYDDGNEKKILETDLKTKIDKVLKTDDVLCVIDVIKASSGRIKSRWIVYQASVLEKMAIIKPKNSIESMAYTYGMFSEKVNSVPEEIK